MERIGPTIVVSGYYGFGNGGDEALLEALLDEWRRVRPDARFIVLSADPETTARRYGVEAVGRTHPLAVFRALRRAHVLVSGGGSLLQDATSPRTVPYYTAVMGLARRLGVPVVVYAQGLGPISRPSLRRMAGRALVRAAAVTVRDEASAREAAALGVDPLRVVLAADPVFAREPAVFRESVFVRKPAVFRESVFAEAPATRGNPAEGREAAEEWAAGLPAGPLLGVSLRPLQRDPKGRATARLVEGLAAVLAPFVDARGLRVTPLPLFPAQDEEPLARLLAALGPDRTAPWPPPPAPTPADLMLDDWLALFGRLELCVTMRLHGLVFAARAGRPFVALADDPKVDAHGAELGLAAESLFSARRFLTLPVDGPANSESAFAELLERAWTRRRRTEAQLRAAVPQLQARARRAVAVGAAVLEARGDEGPVSGATEVEADPPRMAAAPPGSDCGRRRRVYVLDTPVDALTMAETVAAVKHRIEASRRGEGRPGPAHVVTVNPELIMEARKDGAVRRMLERADLVVADGIGVVAAARLLGRPVPERVPGIELTEALLEEASVRGWKVFLLGGEPGVAARAKENLRKKHPEIRIVGVRDGYFGKGDEAAVARAVAAAEPDIVFVGMGAPRQELFIAARREAVRRRGTAAKEAAASAGDWRGVAVAIGVGGSIDVLAGRVRRAPALWRKIGLEWLYRLLRQPSRFRRALVLPRFALLVLFHALRRNLL